MKKNTLVAIVMLLTLVSAQATQAAPPKAGDVLPPFVMQALAVPGDAAALGLDENGPFTIADIPTPFVMIEIIGVYCSVCHNQLPTLTKLYKRLKKAKLNKKIAMLGIAAGGNATEVQYVREKRDYLFPIAHDPEFEIYGALSDPKTPFTMIVDQQGKVLFAHRGIIADANEMLKVIQELVQ